MILGEAMLLKLCAENTVNNEDELDTKQKGKSLKNQNLQEARNAGNDEFYTRMEYIESELSHYNPSDFKDKVVYCPTDAVITTDTIAQSQFVKYFQLNVQRLQIKKLIATSLNYTGSDDVPNYYVLERTETKPVQYQEMYAQCPTDIGEISGDYHSAFCQTLFSEADIVVTNPPFSLARDFLTLLHELGLKYIILGNVNTITYKCIYPLISANKLWVGATNFNNGMYFNVPKGFQYKDTYKFKKEINGDAVNRVASVCWFTNLEHDMRNQDIVLTKQYDPALYPKYDNCDAINVKAYKDIPKDYKGLMGVPITFLDKYNPGQFEIVAFRKGNDGKDLYFTQNGEKVSPYFRILIKPKDS